MASEPESPPESKPRRSRGLLWLSIFVLAGFALFFVIFIVWAAAAGQGHDPCGRADWAGILLVCLVAALGPFTLPCALILLWYGIAPATSTRLPIWIKGSFVVTFGLLVVIAAGLPGSLGSSRHNNIYSALSFLGKINVVEKMYSSTYGAGYSADLAVLGSLVRDGHAVAGWLSPIDEVAVSGKKSTYTFVYAPGHRDSTGKITSYTITARSVCRGYPSFYADESGVIRRTDENRPATAQDPPWR